jgi:hypothetical protein
MVLAEFIKLDRLADILACISSKLGMEKGQRI